MTPGRTFGRFQITRVLGEGGNGIVLEAVDPRLQRKVALKLLHGGASASHDKTARLRREAQALARIDHPNVVAIYESGSEGGKHYIVMELVAGRTLAELIAAKAPLRSLIELLEQAARGVQAAHDVGLLHRDLKPSNVLVDATGARVADFGIARFERPSFKLTEPGTFLGTPAYISPEQASGDESAVGPWSDVYALGAILYEILTQEPPYGHDVSLVDLAMSLTSDDPSPRPRDRVSDAPESLDALCAHALAKDPRDRCATASAFAQALRRHLDGVAPVRSPRTWLWAVPGLVVLGGLVGALVFLVSGPTPVPAIPRRPVAVVRSPAWFALLSERERPALPLPDGLAFGSQPREYLNVKDGSVLVFLPAGPFDMGTDEHLPGMGGPSNDEERPRHRVTLSACFIGKLEVTNAQFARFVEATRHLTTAEQKGETTLVLSGPSQKASWREPHGDGSPALPDHPVVHVSWHDARAYCRWAGLRLPTEAQWEKATLPEVASGWDGRANLGGAGGAERTTAVGSFPDGATGCGALDMLGNVWEFCEDGFDENAYVALPLTDPLRSVDDNRKDVVSVRGLSWVNNPAVARRTIRSGASPTSTHDALGFRVARPGR